MFFALWPPAEVADRLAAIAGEATARYGGRATRRETIHLTLAFLGEVPELRFGELVETAASVRCASFEFCLDRLGFWQHNHLLWAGGEMPAALDALHDKLLQALTGGGFKIDGGGRRFSPHVTLVRKLPSGGDLTAGQEMPLPAVAWPCEQFFLVRSRLASSGSEYRILHQFSLN